MLSKNYSQVLSLTLLFIILIQSNIYCQKKSNKDISKINITMIVSADGFSDLEISAINTFKKVLEEKGLFSADDYNTELLLKVKDTKADNKIILSVVEMQVLPKEAVEVGKKAELFYSMIDEKKKINFPAEGKFIREYVSGVYLNQFRMILDDNLELIDINELESISQRIVSKYL